MNDLGGVYGGSGDFLQEEEGGDEEGASSKCQDDMGVSSFVYIVLEILYHDWSRRTNGYWTQIIFSE